MNNDIIFHIQEYIYDFDFLYNISLIDTRFCIKKRRKNIQDKNNSLHLLKAFIDFALFDNDDIEMELQYLKDFLTKHTLCECIQWYSNILMINIRIFLLLDMVILLKFLNK